MRDIFSQASQRPAGRRAGALGRTFGAALRAGAVALLMAVAPQALAQTAGAPPAANASCTVSAMNRSAPLEADYSFTLYNLPGAGAVFGPGAPPAAAPFRARVVCSDGTLGETALAFPEFESSVVYTGEIAWRRATPIPVGVALTAPQAKLSAGQSTQLRTLAGLTSGAQVDLTARDKGTFYTSSNPLLATVSPGGLVSAGALLAPNFSARVVMTAQNEGIAGSTVLQLGGRGSIAGRIYRADGVTPVEGARVTVSAEVPRQQLGTVTTDAGGNYRFDDAGVGSYGVSVADPASGDIGNASGVLESDGQTAVIDARLNGQGMVTVTVLDGSGAPLPGSLVSFTSLGPVRAVRSAPSGANGQAVFERVPSGPLTVSTRDSASNMVGTASGLLAAGGAANIVLKLQPVGAIAGVVYDIDGATPQAGVQVRISSSARGLLSQAVTGSDGAFLFEGLALADAPYTLDAMQDGRLRARIPNLILTSANQRLVQNLVFAPAGKVTGVVTRSSGAVVEGAAVTLQSQAGLRFTFSTRTDAQGRYAVDGVAVGAFSVSAATGEGEVGSAAGAVGADGQVVTLNLQLAANGIVGTVFERNGSTPVGAGIAVTLAAQGGATMATATNAQGQYGFSVSQPDTYVVTAADGNGNKGSTSLVLTSITPGEPKTLNVVFLGRGAVQGTVRDPSGAVQPGVQVTLTSASLFGGIHAASADSQGRYRIDGVFIGEFSVYARNPSTGLAGVGRGRLAEDNTVAAADVSLAATGTVNGKVLKQDGVTPVANASVQFVVAGAPALAATADAGGNFVFAAAPLGDFTLVATNPLDRDKGQAVSRLVTANETRSMNVRLLGQGGVRVRALAGGQPVAGVLVTLTSASQFPTTYTGSTGADGVVTIAPVFNGDVGVAAEKGSGASRISASGAGTIVNGATIELTLAMQSNPVATLAGTVSKGLSALPQAGVIVSVAPVSGGPARAMTTGADGGYRFEQLDVGRAYRISATVNGRVRARTDVSMGSAGQVLTQNLALLGVGSVGGVVRDLQARPQAGIRVTLTNADPVYGGSWTVTTQSDGSYQLGDVPAGSFVLRAASLDGRMAAQDSGSVRYDADAVAIDMTVVDNAVALPRNLYDANGARFDVQGDGSLAAGVNGVFAGNGVERGAARLEIVVNGVSLPFQNGDGTFGRLTQAGQMVELDELNAASNLNVTRRIYVPKNGYFARNLEILENRTANPVTVGLRLVSNFAQGTVGARVVDTSSGDSTLEVGAAPARDHWLVVDDETDADPFEAAGNPAVAVVFDGAAGQTGASEATLGAVGAAAKLGWQWNNLTIQPGQSIALMHFASQQLSRAAARSAGERLAQLPPEALEGLTAEERLMVVNFKLPADGLSPMAPLPPGGLSVSGVVLAGDGLTPIPAAAVTFKSSHPLFGRRHRATADAAGRYAFATAQAGSADVVTIPKDGFSVTAQHPSTRAVTAPGYGAFDGEAAAAQKDLLFAGTGILKGSVRRHTGALVTSGTVTIPYLYPGKNISEPLTAPIDAAGAFTFIAIAPDNYLPSATQPHPQGMPVRGVAGEAVYVGAGQTGLASVTMEETGELVGTVRAANGEAVVGASVALDPSASASVYRQTTTDTGGAYRFTDVALGKHAVAASGANGLSAAGEATIGRDATALLNLQLAGTGQLRVQVNYARGVPAIGASVQLLQRPLVKTDSAGQASFSAPSDVPLPVLAYHPDNSALRDSASTTIAGNGASADVVLTLPAAGSIVGTVYRPGGATPAAGILVTLRRQDGVVSQLTATTNAAGAYSFRGLTPAPYTVSAEDRVTMKFADSDRSIVDDGQDITANLTLADNRLALPSDLRDANDFLFDVQPNGVIGAGWRARNNSSYAVYSGGSQLEINGQAFVGDSSAALEAGRRQLVITQPGAIAGLSVRRKIFVPRGGYFARYLEILDNPGTSPLTVGVKLRTPFRNNSGVTSVVDSASGDGLLSATGAQRDTWAVLDDSRDLDPFISNSSPATATLVGDGAAPLAHDVFTHNASDGSALEAGWSAVTVPAQGRVILMHFELQQVNRAGARAAAQRLQQLPPEALAELGPDEIAAVANFVVPANGVSTVEALPGLLGTVSGVAYEGDRRTVVAGLALEMRSTHPLFGRTWLRGDYDACNASNRPAGLLSNAAGAFSLAGTMQDQGSIALPLGFDVQVDAARTASCYYGSGTALGHPVSHVPAPGVVASFAPNAGAASADLVFDSGILSGSIAGPADFGVGSGSVSLTLPANANLASSYTVSTPIQVTGAYTLTGLPSGSYGVTLSVPHDQGTALVGIPVTVDVAAGQTANRNLSVEPTGSVGGTAMTASATAAVGAPVVLQSFGGARSVTRSTSVDSLGRFYLSAVPVGSYTLTVTDPRTSAKVVAAVSVDANGSVTRNLTLLGVSTARVTVRYARGADAAGIPVLLTSSATSGTIGQGVTDVQGRLDVAVPVGTYKISAYVPDDVSHTGQWSETSGVVAVNNAGFDATLTLKPHAAVRVTVTDLDRSSALLPGASITLVDAVCPSGCNRGTSGANGQFLVTNVHEGAYTIIARAADGRSAETNGVVTVAEDGKTIDRTVGVTAILDKFGLLSFVGENQLYAVKAKAGDVISVSIAGVQVNGSASAYLTRARVYQPNKSQLASGYGYDSRNGSLQYNESGNLLQIAAPVTGNYPIALSPYYTDPQYLGGFRLQVKVNGVAVPVHPYLDGGSVQGMVVKGDTTPAPGQPVELKTTDALGMRVRVLADALGAYSVGGVPLGDFTVAALDPATKASMVSASGQLATVGETAIRDLALPKRTTVQVQVAIVAPLSVPTQMNVTVKDALGTRLEGPLTFAAGSTLSAARSMVVHGDQVTISAVHPSNSNATTSAVVQGGDGETVPLTLTLAFTGIQGTVYSSEGVPVVSAYVRAWVVSTRRSLGAIYTNSSGLYSFGGLPVGEEILVQAQDARNSVYVGARTTLQLNQANVLDVRYPGVGKIVGRVTNASGQAVPGASVTATYIYDEMSNATTYVSGSTAQDGSYALSNVPVGLPLQVGVALGTNFGTVSTSAPAALQAAGQTNTVNMVMPLPTGSVLVRMVDADGKNVPAGVCYTARVDAANGQATARYVCGPETVFTNVPPGAAVASASGSPMTAPAPAQFTAIDGQQALAVLTASTVKGVVRFADGTPVPNPSVSLVTAGGSTLFAYNTGAQGDFRIIGVPVGGFTIKAEHGASALVTSATANLASLNTAFTRDLTLPPSAGVSGVFRNRSGTVIAGADVYVRSSAIDVDRYAKTDGQGAYSFSRVAQGNVTVVARDPASRLIASGEAVLGAADARIDLTLPESTAVSGTVTNEGIPVAAVAVSLSSVKTFGAFGPTTLTTTSDMDGRYSFGAGPVGDVRATATVGSLIASALGTSVAGTPLTLDLQMGGSVNLPYSLRGTDTSLYDVTCSGSMSDGGFAGRTDAYDGVYNLSVGGTAFPCSAAAGLKTGARELLIGPYLVRNLTVTRRIFVPAAGGYARYVDTFVNKTASAITLDVSIDSNLGSDSGTQLRVAPVATGGRYAVTTDSGSDPALGHVFASAGADLPGVHTFNPPSDSVKSVWTLTVPAGATASLMHFAVQRAALDVTAVQQQAEALSTMTQADMFNGLSAADKASIKNFKVTQ